MCYCVYMHNILRHMRSVQLLYVYDGSTLKLTYVILALAWIIMVDLQHHCNYV